MSLPAGSIYRRLLGYSLAYWPILVVAIIGMVVSAASETAFAALMKPLLDGSFVERDPQTMRWVPILLLMVFMARGISTFLTGYLMAVIGRGVIKTFREQMFSKFLVMPATFYDGHASATLISKVTYDTEQVAAAATTSFTVAVRDSLTILGLLGWMFYLSWQMTAGFLVITPFVVLLVVFVTRRFRKISKRIQASMGQVTHVTQEMIEGNRVIKIFGGHAYESKQFDVVNEQNRKQNIKLALTRSASSPLVQFFVALVLVVIIYFATQDKYHGSISVGTFMSFMTAMMMLLTPIRRLINVNATLQKGIAAAESIFAVLDTEQEIDQGKTALGEVRGELRFENVSFSYTEDSPLRLNNVSFTAKAGETIALVGRSGSGKSTLANLAPRLYEPTAGKIYLDGLSIDEIRLDSLRDQIGYVGQHVTLFNDTIRNNIAYGRLHGAPEDQIIEAAKAAYAWDFISELQQGLDTLVGEKGMLLSGGQRQRLAIARALLKDAPVLILDEATASLDTESERHIQAALEALSNDRTTLVIAHRLSTIERADRILVMQQGEIVEQGPHAELMTQKGIYQHLHGMQFNEDSSDS